MPNKILVIDDDMLMVHILCFKLRQAGYDLLTANNGRDGYALACEQIPDAIISDYQMPIIDGFEMARKLYANPSTAEIPIILLTARSHKIPLNNMAETNIRLMVAKPFSALQLVENLAELVVSRSPKNDDGETSQGEGHAA